MALDLLRLEIEHLYRHDLEGLIWMVFLQYNNGTREPRMIWTLVTLVAMINATQKKLCFLRRYDEKSATESLKWKFMRFQLSCGWGIQIPLLIPRRWKCSSENSRSRTQTTLGICYRVAPRCQPFTGWLVNHLYVQTVLNFSLHRIQPNPNVIHWTYIYLPVRPLYFFPCQIRLVVCYLCVILVLIYSVLLLVV